MGIDVYASWPGETQKEADEQCMHVDISSGQPKASWHGSAGYLHEAYVRNPSLGLPAPDQGVLATRELVPEAFSATPGGVPIPAAVMRERLPKALAAAKSRAHYRLVEQVGDVNAYVAEVSKNLADFVEICELKEREHGTPCLITVWP
jgi:hypothetical protein